MAVLMNVGKPLQTTDNIFMTEWVAIFRESGLRDDVSIANLQETCLKLVVLARGPACELHVHWQVERAQRAHPRANGKCLRCGSEMHCLQDCTRPRRPQATRLGKPKPAPKKEYSKAKGRKAEAQTSKSASLVRCKEQG